MSDAEHRRFVLVHGAWHGGWVWRDVLHRLRTLGHMATAPTLTGLGERRHIGNDSADLETHVEDLVAHIEMEDLRDITLVGWSYGGMVITGGFARIPERISRLVYLDAFMPEDGKALVDYIPAEMRLAHDVHKEQNQPLPPFPLSFFGVTDPLTVGFVEPRLAPQPWRTFYQPVKARNAHPNIPISHVVCTGFGPSPFTMRLPEIEANPRIRTVKIDTSHHCMLTAVEDTVIALVES